jgi:hypothetical protein
MQRAAARYEEEGVAVPRYIPTWNSEMDTEKDLDNVMAAGACAAPDIIYAQGMPADINPDPESFDRKI